MTALAEADRLALMQQAGCNLLRCGLTISKPFAGGLPTLTHHYRSKPTGRATTAEAVLPLTTDVADDEIVAWIAEQHDG